jgi:hypothetical protein
MKMLTTVILFLSFIPLTFSQVFVTEKSLTELAFNGTMMGSGHSKTGIVTLRETPKTQELLIVLEVADFKFQDEIQEDDFNDTFMESSLYPQIRLSATLNEKIDLTKDGIYILSIPAKMTIRRNSKTSDFKVRLEITGDRMTFAFEKDLALTDYQIPYAGQGSEIGTNAKMKLFAHMIRRI